MVILILIILSLISKTQSYILLSLLYQQKIISNCLNVLKNLKDRFIEMNIKQIVKIKLQQMSIDIFLNKILFIFIYFDTQMKTIQIHAVPSLSVLTLSDLRWMQGFKYILTLTLNLNFLFQGAFHPSVAHGTNQPHEIAVFGGFRGPSRPSVQ